MTLSNCERILFRHSHSQTSNDQRDPPSKELTNEAPECCPNDRTRFAYDIRFCSIVCGETFRVLHEGGVEVLGAVRELFRIVMNEDIVIYLW